MVTKKPLTTLHKKPRKRRISKELRARKAAQMKLNRRSRQPSEPNMKVSLRMSHFINGIRFGPGTIIVKQGVAHQFLREEQQQINQEAALYSTKATLIGPRGPTGTHTTREVAPETFDFSLANAQEIEKI